MAGLLDFLNTDEGRLGLGLLAAAGPRSDGMGFGGRVQEAFAGQDARKKQQAEAEWRKLQMEEARDQMAQRQQAQQQAMQAQAEAVRVRGLVANAGRGATGAVESAMPQGMGIPGQQAQPINFQALLQQGVPFELVKQLADSQNLGRQKVARTADIEGPNGSKQVQGFDDYGQPVGAGVNGYVAPQLIDQGDRKTFAKPMIGQSFGVNMSPEARDASARGWAGVNQSAARLQFDKAGGADGVQGSFGKAPPGYRWKSDGSMEAVPGGPADIKAGVLGAKQEKQQQGVIAQATRITDKVDQALEKVGYNTAGAGGTAMGWIPGTEARDLESDLATIKANLGFAELQAMRDASPTGGALGQVAVQELVALQSTVASLDKAQSPGQLKERLKEIKTHYNNWKNTMQPNQGGADGGWDTPKTPAAKPPQPMRGMVRGGYKFKGGDPADQSNWEKQ